MALCEASQHPEQELPRGGTPRYTNCRLATDSQQWSYKVRRGEYKQLTKRSLIQTADQQTVGSSRSCTMSENEALALADHRHCGLQSAQRTNGSQCKKDFFLLIFSSKNPGRFNDNGERLSTGPACNPVVWTLSAIQSLSRPRVAVHDPWTRPILTTHAYGDSRLPTEAKRRCFIIFCTNQPIAVIGRLDNGAFVSCWRSLLGVRADSVQSLRPNRIF